MNNDELTIKKGRVLAAAEKCPTAKAALMEIFPEAFEKKDEWTDITDRLEMKIKDGELRIVDPHGNWTLWYLGKEGMRSAPNIENEVYWKAVGNRVFKRNPC